MIPSVKIYDSPAKALKWAGDEVHLYVVPVTNLSLATVDRAKRPNRGRQDLHIRGKKDPSASRVALSYKSRSPRYPRARNPGLGSTGEDLRSGRFAEYLERTLSR